MGPYVFLFLCVCLVQAQRIFNIVSDCGCIGDNATSNTKRLQACFARAGENPGSTVVIPQGVYLTGPVQLYSNTTLIFSEAGAWLQGSAD